MPLEAGEKLGPYEIKALIGAGGMGEVYRAADARLERDVAIKVVTRGEDAAPQRQLLNEARAVGSLKHPNIVQVHDIGEHKGVPYLVMELVDGDSLRRHLQSRRIPVENQLEWAVQMASGVAAAHRAGVTHRDLKPENILIAEDGAGAGTVKILDFGLARRTPRSTVGQEAASTYTDPSLLKGTPSYMSPEQAGGESVDHRTDQFAIGVILYEMATGKRAFHRPTLAETLAAIIQGSPEPIPESNPLPQQARWVIERCLAKQPQQRYGSTDDLLEELKRCRARSQQPASGKAGAGKRKLMLAMGGVVAVAALLSVLALLQPAPVPRHVPFAVDRAAESEPAWSPDGKTLAYIREVDGIGQVFTHGVDGGMAVQLTRGDAPCSRPFWSPDGTRVYYQSGSGTWSIGATGGQTKIELTGSQSAISPDGSTIAHGHGSAGGGIFLHSTATSTETAYPSKLEGQAKNRYIQFSPDGKLIGALWPSQVEHNIYNKFWLLPFPPGGEVRQLELEPTGFSWMADNQRIVAAIGLAGSSNHHLHIVDTRNGESTALTSGPGNEEYPAVAQSQNRIAYTSGPHEKDIVEIPVEAGEVQSLLATTRAEALPDWSPDGSQISYVQDTSGEGSEIWLRSVKGDWSRSLVQNRGGVANATYTNPRFSPDGRRLAYESWEAAGHLIWVTALGGGQSIRVAPERNHQHYPAWSPDGAWVAYRTNIGNKRVIEKAPSGGGTPVALCESNASSLVWSGKGDLLAFTNVGLYVVSSNGGAPKKTSDLRSQSFGFTRDGRGLLVLSQVKSRWGLWFIDVATGSSRLLRELSFPASTTIQGFSLHPDGKRIAAETQTSRTDIWLLENFERPSLWRRVRGLGY